MKSNKNGVKLLAAVMAFAMVLVAGFAFIGDSEEVDATAVVPTAEAVTITGTAASIPATINDDGDYKITADTSITVDGKAASTKTVTIYLAEGKTVTIVGASGSNSSDITVNVVPANADCSKAYATGTDSKITIAGMTGGTVKVTNEKFGTYGATSATASKLTVFNTANVKMTAGSITGLTNSDVNIASEKSLYTATTSVTVTNLAGVSVTDSEKITYYPKGYSLSETVISASGNTDVKIFDGSATVVTKSGANIVDKIVLKDIKSSAGVTITEGASTTIDGTYTAGTITVEKGVFAVTATKKLFASDSAVINAYADAAADSSSGFAAGKKIGATPADAAGSSAGYSVHADLYVYGNTGSNKTVTITGANEVYFVGANTTSMTITSDNGTVMVSVSGNVTLADRSISGLVGTLTLIEGTFQTSGDVDFGDVLTVSNEAVLKLGNAATQGAGAIAQDVAIDLAGKMNVYGTLMSYDGTTGVTITVLKKINPATAPGEFRSFNGSIVHQSVTIGLGSCNDTDIPGIIDMATETIPMGPGSIITGHNYGQSQNVVVRDYVDIKGNSTINIYGGFEVPEGTTVTIYAGSKIVVSGSASEVKIAGKVIVERGGYFDVQTGTKSVEITGVVEAEEDETAAASTGLNFSAKSVEIKNGGKIISGGLLSGSAMTIGEGSELIVLGKITNTGIYNKGTVTFNEAIVGAAITIHNVAAGAEVNIVSYTAAAKASDTITIDDDGLKYAGVAAYDDTSGDNSIVLTALGDGTGYSGLKIISSVAQETIDGVVKNCKYLSIEGVVSFYPSDGTVAVDADGILVGGPRLLVTGDITFGEKVQMTVNNNAVLKVSGTITAIQDYTLITTTGKIIVTGEVVAKTNTNITSIDAALYKVKDAAANTIFHYTTLAKAIEAGATEIDLYGTVTVMDSLDIPTGVTVKTGTATVYVGTTDARDVTVKFADGAILKGTSGVTVNGTLEFANKANLKVSVTSDVAVVGDVTAKYTNIFSAVNGASAGDEITVTAASVTINADLTIKEGVTLKVPAGKTITVSDNVTVTVDGTVIAYSGFSAATGFDVTEKTNRSALVVNGKFLTAEAMTTAQLNTKYHTAGAYYDIVGADGTYTYISPVDIAAASAKSAGTIDIYGKISFGDVKVEADKDNAVTINLKSGSVVAGNIDITSYVTVDAVTGARFDGTIASSVGGVKVVNATVFTVAGKVLTDGTEILSVKGTPVKVGTESTDPKSSFAITEGTVTADGTNTNKFDATEVQSFSIAEGAVFNVTGAADVKNLSVAGTLSVANVGVLTVEGYIQVLGTLIVAEYDATKDSAAGTANIEVMYVGITKTKTTGAAATVTAPAISGLKTVYLAAGSTVSEKVLENLGKTTKFTVEGAEYLTVYTSQNILVSSIVYPELDGAKVLGWQYTNSSGKLADASDKIIGDIKEASAQMKYDVYTVSFLVDSGISDIYIDGELVGTEGLSQNYRTANITAGAHQITYKLKAGFGGDVKVTFNGQAAADGKFNISKDMPFQDDNGTAITYKIVISGVALEPIIEPEQKDDSGMGITDYLLIVLVILAAILVVVVAIRMMRS